MRHLGGSYPYFPGTIASVSFPLFARRLILLVCTVVAACVTTAAGDTWWALRAGRDIWHDHTISLTDRYSYTAAGDHWPDHEWLWQAVIYPLHVLGAMPLLTVCTALLAGGTLAFSTAVRTVRRTDLLVLVLAVPALSASWTLRPQMVSMLCFALILWLIRERRWWWCVPLMLIWANAHGGVVFGGIALGSACVAAALLRAHRSALPPLIAVTVLGAIATLLTPLGTELWHYVLTSGSRPFQERINEWKPAYQGLTFYSGAFWAWVVAVVVLVAFTAVRRRTLLTTWPVAVSLVATTVTLPLAIDAKRNMTMFVVAAIPLVVHLLRPAMPRVRPRDAVPYARPLLAGAAVAGAAAMTLTYLAAPSGLGWRPMGRAVQQAVEACPGHVYTTYDSGAYLIWFTPQVKVFADNRQDPYSAQILDLSLLTHDSAYVDTFRTYDVRCAALLSWNVGTIETLRHDGWTTALSDDGWLVLTAPRDPLEDRPKETLGTSLGSPS